MAGHLKLFYEPFGVPGDVETKTITGVASTTIGTFVEATYTHWMEGAKKAASEWGNFLQCKTEANTIGNTEAELFAVNTQQVQNIIEY